MKDESKTKKQLIEELKRMRQQAEEFESRAFPIRKRREDLLRKYEDSGRSLFDHMLDGYAYCKILFENNQPSDFIYLDVNPAFKILTGLKNVIGQKVSQIIPGIRESNPELLEIYGRVALTGKPERFETYVQSLEKWFYVSVFSPAKEYFVATFENITERKRAEDILRESEEVLRDANEYLEQRVRERTMDLQNLTEEIKSSRDDLRKLASELVLAEERERKRIAAVLHDEIAQTLAVAKMRVTMLQGIAADDESQEIIRETKELISQSIQETRALMNEISNPLLSSMGMEAACKSFMDQLMARYPIQIGYDMQDSSKNVDPDVKLILFQVIRELLNNVVKHSKARNAHVLIHMDNDRIRAEVRDDGKGFDPIILGAPTSEGGFGLFSIRERLAAFNGSLQIESAPGTGTVVMAILPASLH